MAVMDERIYHPTDALILPKPRRHYRVGLRCEHWQLRSQIGLTSPRQVYYVAGNGNNQVHKLDTTEHESELVKILTFSPRCLVVKKGWICCGGESGEFVAFQVDDARETRQHPRVDAAHAASSMSPIQQYVEYGGPRSNDVLDAFRDPMHGLPSEDRLQLALDSVPGENETMPALIPPSPRPDVNTEHKTLVANSKAFGKERINCITLWFPPTSTDSHYSGVYSESVAVLANNDKHVTVVGLENQEAMDELSYPDFVNRALISPDGRLLAAICDDPYLYVHQRVPKQGATHGIFTRKNLADFEWKLCAKVHLKSQRKEDRSDQRGSFAACFSNTGRYLAVGTQYGVISVFETAAFSEPSLDPLITTFTTSRPKEDVGAVRDMAFCPGPFDLLAWTEHRGRVGVADIRSNYGSRQILDLSQYDDYEQIMVTEKGSIDPRLLDRTGDGLLTMADSTDAAAARRLARRPTTERQAGERSATEYNPQPLVPEETMVLEALTAHRRRRDQIAAEAARRNDPAAGTRMLERLQNRTSSSRDPAFFRESRNTSRVSEMEQARELIRNVNRLNDLDRAERLRARRAVQTAETNLVASVQSAANAVAALRTMRNQAGQVVLPIPQSNVPARPNSNSDATDLETLYQNFEMLGPYHEPGQGGETSGRDPHVLASVWSNMLRSRDTDSEPLITAINPRTTRTRLADRAAALNMGRIDHEHDDTAGLAWSEDGRVL
ncbi:hypothetical protein N0V82_006730 [Gnomoniopsis sp. IMI 355080]|nr:hypothetical protein N0V82_006730 [Gnomoniopsis sp. IMI 355080]